MHGSPIPVNLCPFPKTVGITLPSLTYEITQSIKTNKAIFWDLSLSEMAHTLWSVFLSKLIHFLPIILFFTEFFQWWDKNWASLGPETRCVISVGRPWVLAEFESWSCVLESHTGFCSGLESQSELNGFSGFPHLGELVFLNLSHVNRRYICY